MSGYGQNCSNLLIFTDTCNVFVWTSFTQEAYFFFPVYFMSCFSWCTVSLHEVNLFVTYCFLQEVVKTYITYHRLISYSLYLIGMLRRFSFLQTFSECLNFYLKKQQVNHDAITRVLSWTPPPPSIKHGAQLVTFECLHSFFLVRGGDMFVLVCCLAWVDLGQRPEYKCIGMLLFDFSIQKQTEQTQVVLIINIVYTQALDKVQLIAYMHDFCPVFAHL